MVRISLLSVPNIVCGSLIFARCRSHPGAGQGWHQQRVVASWFNLGTIFLPVVLGYYVMAVLVQLPKTKLFRLALLPVVVWLIFTAGMTLDFSWRQPEYAYTNLIFAASRCLHVLCS